MDGTLNRLALSLFLIVFSSCGADGLVSYNSAIKDRPIDRGNDHSQAIGFYSNGSLIEGFTLPDEGFAHLKIFRLRDRAWGTKTLIDTLLSSAAALRRNFPKGDRVQIGDMSASEGGFLSRHSSHQNGLDADVAYLNKNHIERDPDVWGEAGFAEDFVVNGKLTKTFDTTRNWFLLKEIVLRRGVSRIFVDPIIKKTFCAKSLTIDPKLDFETRTEVLRRLRPYPNHDDHFHMRVDCPSYDTRCITQEAPPTGSGCDSIETLSIDEHEL